MVKVGKIKIGGKEPFFLIAGPCVIENERITLSVAKELKIICEDLSIPLIFKSSYDKANRSSIQSFRGPGLKKGLKILSKVKEKFGIPLLSDVHSTGEIKEAAKVLDIIQIPAFLCRQTDLLLEAGKSGKVVNVKKGQFLSPVDVKNIIEKINSTGNRKVLLTERGTFFGYHNLVVDFRSLFIMKKFGCPVIFDATHSVQQPALSEVSGGRREFVPLLVRSALAAGCAGLFLEVHPNPEEALSDGPNMIGLDDLPPLLEQAKEIDIMVKKWIS